jgi:hypothetical protein
MRWFIGLILVMCLIHTIGNEFTSKVYACSDKGLNPPDVQKHCKQLTKYQWWGAYYERK